MASIKFGGLVLVVIIISLALKYSSACAQEGIQRKAKWFTSISTENHESNSQNMAKMGGRKVLVGRNMQKGDELLKRETEKKGESNLKQEISGNDAASKKSMDVAETSHKNSQDNSNVYQRQEWQKEYESKKNTAAYLPPKSTTPVVLSDHHDHDHYHDHDHRHRAHRHEKDNKNHEFLEATNDDDDDDVINLMRRDYRGTDRPRRKPPINNHEPSD